MPTPHRWRSMQGRPGYARGPRANSGQRRVAGRGWDDCQISELVERCEARLAARELAQRCHDGAAIAPQETPLQSGVWLAGTPE
jgi:hypothetical protein